MSNLIRTAQLADLPQLKAIYNHAVAHSTATFDLYPRVTPTGSHGFRHIKENMPFLSARPTV